MWMTFGLDDMSWTQLSQSKVAWIMIAIDDYPVLHGGYSRTRLVSSSTVHIR